MSDLGVGGDYRVFVVLGIDVGLNLVGLETGDIDTIGIVDYLTRKAVNICS
jgi:hypothetical protein